MNDVIHAHFDSHQQTLDQLRACTPVIVEAAECCVEALRRGHKLLLCGNGGSAGDAQHIAAELVGRFVADRRALPAIALTTDTSALTAIANDYGYEQVFARQVEGLAQPGDVLVAISTSGNSANVNVACEQARTQGCQVIALSGKGGGALTELADVNVVVPSSVTARIQECHILIGHILCDLIEQGLNLGTKEETR